RQIGLDRLVALKMIRDDDASGAEEYARFRAEALTVARLQHPNIVQIYAVGEHAGRPFFALELVAGGRLDEFTRGVPQGEAATARFIATLARAIQAAHEHGIVHRDLKPGNILLHAPTGVMGTLDDVTPRIADFGLAKQLAVDSGQTGSGAILGTPSYMAPEQAHGQARTVGPAADVYALGAVCYELLTGRPPFRGSTVLETLDQVRSQEPLPPSRLRPRLARDLETICLKCLHKDARQRYASATALADDLQRFLRGQPIRARPASALETVWKWCKRHPRSAAAGLTGLAVCAVLVLFHIVRLESALRSQERQTAVAAGELLLQKAEAAVNAGRWADAESLLSAEAPTGLEAPLLRFPAEPRLHELRERAAALRGQAGQRLTDQKRLHEIRRLRDEALVATLTSSPQAGDDPRRELEALAARGLRLFGLELEENRGLSLDSAHYSAAEKDEIRESCCQLLLHLATRLAAGARRPDTERALCLLDRAARLYPSASFYPRCQARWLKQLGRPAPSVTTAPAEPQHFFEFFLRGQEHYQDHWLPEAMRDFESALALRGNDFGAQFALAQCYLKARVGLKEVDRGHYLGMAIARLSNCLEQQPDQPWPRLLRGYAHGERREFQAAEADFALVEKSLQQRPNDTIRYGLLVNRGLARLLNQQHDGAIADLREALALRPQELPAYVNLAQARYERQEWDAALALLDRAATLTPPESAAGIHRHRARLHQARGDTDAALHDLDRAARLDPDGPRAPRVLEDRCQQARLLLAQQPEKAAAVLDCVLEISPDQPQAHRLRAEALLRLERFDGAIASLDRYFARDIELRRPVAPAYAARALAHSKVGRLPEAIEDYSRALELTPDDGATRLRRAWAYVVLEAATLAQRDFEAVLREQPRHADALLGRAYCRVKVGEHRAAVRDVEEALKLEPSPEARFHYNAARVYAVAVPRAELEERAGAAGARELRLRYQDRAAALLREALATVPRDQQPTFWWHTVHPDPALSSIRRTAAYVQLADRYPRPPGEPAPR
ncbi:MAG: protein kinase, partial [Planctomycetia bacterium]|nr:protein kinase [Planctomycetia bacterium]